MIAFDGLICYAERDLHESASALNFGHRGVLVFSKPFLPKDVSNRRTARLVGIPSKIRLLVRRGVVEGPSQFFQLFVVVFVPFEVHPDAGPQKCWQCLAWITSDDRNEFDDAPVFEHFSSNQHRLVSDTALTGSCLLRVAFRTHNYNTVDRC